MADWAWFYYKFSVVTLGPSEAPKKFEDITVERDARLSDEFYRDRHKTGAAQGLDELVKLEDLRKKGILSDAEFLQQKTKILNER